MTGGVVAVVWFTAPVDTVGKIDFQESLKIPPLAESEIDAEGRRVFDLTAQAGSAELMRGKSSDTWGFNGDYLGPTLRAERGEEVLVNVHNELDEDTTVHWHGMHLPARMDGGPHQMVQPGDTWSPTWTIDQPAATLWYHPHPHGKTREHVTRGLAGMFILDDPKSEALNDLPNEYGVDDIPVIVQDRDINDSGELNRGNFGDKILVNGTYGPYLDVTTESVRLRLLNASATRVYNFGLSDDREFSVIGSGGGLLPAPVRTTRLALSPGERAEIIVQLTAGEDVVLRSTEPDLGINWFSAATEGGKDRFDILELRAADELVPSKPLPQALAEPPSLAEAGAGAQVDRTFELRSNKINGKSMDMSRIDETIEVGSTEVWEVQNTDGDFHNFHVHDVQFQVLSIDGEPPPPELAGWKDTVFLRPGASARLAMQFTDYTDPNHPYMIHCHRLRHEDRGMMAQFVVVEPGESAGRAPAHDH